MKLESSVSSSAMKTSFGEIVERLLFRQISLALLRSQTAHEQVTKEERKEQEYQYKREEKRESEGKNRK